MRHVCSDYFTGNFRRAALSGHAHLRLAGAGGLPDHHGRPAPAHQHHRPDGLRRRRFLHPHHHPLLHVGGVFDGTGRALQTAGGLLQRAGGPPGGRLWNGGHCLLHVLRGHFRLRPGHGGRFGRHSHPGHDPGRLFGRLRLGPDGRGRRHRHSHSAEHPLHRLRGAERRLGGRHVPGQHHSRHFIRPPVDRLQPASTAGRRKRICSSRPCRPF